MHWSFLIGCTRRRIGFDFDFHLSGGELAQSGIEFPSWMANRRIPEHLLVLYAHLPRAVESMEAPFGPRPHAVCLARWLEFTLQFVHFDFLTGLQLHLARKASPDLIEARFSRLRNPPTVAIRHDRLMFDVGHEVAEFDRF